MQFHVLVVYFFPQIFYLIVGFPAYFLEHLFDVGPVFGAHFEERHSVTLA